MTKTALQIAQEAALKLGLKQPTMLFSGTDRTAIELREALVEAADKILHMHDWGILKKQETHTGNGTQTEFPYPADYLRFPKDAELWSSRLEYPMTHIAPEDWLGLDVRSFDTVYGSWSTFGGNIVYRPALADGETVRFWYVSDQVCTDASGTPKAAFTADDDTFRLDDRALELTLVWVFRSQKGLDYAEDMQTAEFALARHIERDKGPRVISQRSSRRIRAPRAYPGQIDA